MTNVKKEKRKKLSNTKYGACGLAFCWFPNPGNLKISQRCSQLLQANQEKLSELDGRDER